MITNEGAEHLVAGELEASVYNLGSILIFPPPKNSFLSIARRATFRAPFCLTLRHYEVGFEDCPKREDLGKVVSTEPVAQTRSEQ